MNAPKNSKPKKTSVLGFMFAPSFGTGFGAFSESVSHFRQTIAMILVRVGLLTPEYMQLIKETGKTPGIVRMLGRAKKNLVYDKAHLPQLLVFYVLAGGVALAWLMLFVFVFAFLNGAIFA